MSTGEIIIRAFQLSGAKNDSQLAEKMGIKRNTFNSRKKRGTIEELLLKRAIEKKHSLDFLFYGIEKKSNNIENEALLEIQEWLDEEKRKNPDVTTWFRYEFEKKFPYFEEWKKRKEEQQMQDSNSGNSKVA